MDKQRDALLKNITSGIESRLLKLYEIWEECGYEGQDLVDRELTVQTNVLLLVEEMIQEEDETKQSTTRSIEQHLNDLDLINKELGTNVNTEGLEDLPLNKVLSILKREMSRCTEIKNERLSKFKELKEIENELCTALGFVPRTDLDSVLPADQQLDEFNRYLTEKVEEKARRFKIFSDTKASILSLIQELEIDPKTDFEKQVISSNESKFCLSKENMARLKDLHQSYEQYREEAKSLSDELREKLSNLWERLQESYEYRNDFLLSNPGFKKKSLSALKEEIKRCEEKKRLNIKQFVLKIREELNDIWDQCCFGKQQKQSFLCYYSDCFTEDLLELHELEVQKMKKYYEDNSDLLRLVKRYKALWDAMMDLENRGHDRCRLFKNRGGQLLKEEKERKRIQKELPKIEEHLKDLLKAYKDKEGHPFLYQDECVLSTMDSQWEQHQKLKEQEKEARKKGRAGDGDSHSSTKRKIIQNNTPAAIPVKISRLGTTEKTRKEDPVERQHSAVVRRIFDRTGTRKHHFQIPHAIPITGDTISTAHQDLSMASTVASTYSDFESHLEKQTTTSRSTVVGHCLKDRNIMDNITTPVKPPRKNLAITPCMQKTPQFRTPQTNPRLRTPRNTGLKRGAITAPRLATTRGRLPIII